MDLEHKKIWLVWMSSFVIAFSDLVSFGNSKLVLQSGFKRRIWPAPRNYNTCSSSGRFQQNKTTLIYLEIANSYKVEKNKIATIVFYVSVIAEHTFMGMFTC